MPQSSMQTLPRHVDASEEAEDAFIAKTLFRGRSEAVRNETTLGESGQRERRACTESTAKKSVRN